MSKSIFKSNESQDISGFYYDVQKNNPLLRITLHANTKPPASDYDEWVNWGIDSLKDKIKSDFPLKDEFDLDIDDNNPFPYGAMPLCSSIVNEDFNISIANNWGEFVGSQAIQDSFNTVYKQLEPYTSFVGDQLNKIHSVTKDYKSDNKFVDSFVTALNTVIPKVSKASKDYGNVLSRTLIVQGTRFKYYGGTGISFSNLGMKFTLFADYIEQLKFEKQKGLVRTGNYVWKTPDDQLKTLLPYAIGKYVPFFDKNDSATGFLDKIIPDSWKKEYDSIKDIANKFFQWQMPPGGFKADVQFIDTQQKGTLMLKIGPYYRLINLVIQDIQLNYSKAIAKYYDPIEKKIKTCPLYCDVVITFSPVSKYSDEVLKKFVMSRTTIDNVGQMNSVYNLERDINKSIGLD